VCNVLLRAPPMSCGRIECTAQGGQDAECAPCRATHFPASDRMPCPGILVKEGVVFEENSAMFELRELLRTGGPLLTRITSRRYRGQHTRPNSPEAIRFRALMGQILDQVLDADTTPAWAEDPHPAEMIVNKLAWCLGISVGVLSMAIDEIRTAIRMFLEDAMHMERLHHQLPNAPLTTMAIPTGEEPSNIELLLPNVAPRDRAAALMAALGPVARGYTIRIRSTGQLRWARLFLGISEEDLNDPISRSLFK